MAKIDVCPECKKKGMCDLCAILTYGSENLTKEQNEAITAYWNSDKAEGNHNKAYRRLIAAGLPKWGHFSNE